MNLTKDDLSVVRIALRESVRVYSGVKYRDNSMEEALRTNTLKNTQALLARVERALWEGHDRLPCVRHPRAGQGWSYRAPCPSLVPGDLGVLRGGVVG
jgi:hypothetical protein